MSSSQNKQPFTRGFPHDKILDDLTANQSGMPCSPKSASKGSEKMVSPGRVRTMKEYEEQMAELKKENFNLKLRIYFIEERQEQMKGLKDADEIFKKNVELCCELETLKKDLSEKEDLLLQSARAMEILQSQHKKEIEDLKLSFAREKAYLGDHILNLQKDLREKELSMNQFDSSSAMYAMALGYNRAGEASEVEDVKSEANQLIEKERKIMELETKIGELEHRLLSSGAAPICVGRKTTNADSANVTKDGAVRQRLRREEKGLAKQLQDAHSKLAQLEEQTQTMQTRLHDAQLTCDNKESDITKLQEEHRRACVTIQALLKKNKLRDKEVSLLKSEIDKKDKLIQDMSLPYRSFPSSDNCENGDKSNEQWWTRLIYSLGFG